MKGMKLQVIILGAGYGTRLQRDVDSDLSGDFKHLNGISKALLPIGNEELISHWIEKLSDYTEHFFVVTNNVFYSQFEKWSEKFPGRVSVVNDQTNSNEERMGAVASIQFAISHFELQNCNNLVIAGDTLLYSDFGIGAFLDLFHATKETHPNCCLVTTYTCENSETKKYGILEVDLATSRVLNLLEKPDPSETDSRLACPCFYLLSPQSHALLKDFLEEKKNSPLRERDAAGHFIKYIIPKSFVLSFAISGRFDVGGLESYKECNNYFTNAGERQKTM